MFGATIYPKAILAMYSLEREGWQWHQRASLGIEIFSSLMLSPIRCVLYRYRRLDVDLRFLFLVRAGVLCRIDMFCFLVCLHVPIDVPLRNLEGYPRSTERDRRGEVYTVVVVVVVVVSDRMQ